MKNVGYLGEAALNTLLKNSQGNIMRYLPYGEKGVARRSNQKFLQSWVSSRIALKQTGQL
jgi:hypothetical protein